MSLLCITTEMTSAEWASWVQAIGSIAAILAAASIAIWQSRAQHRSAMLLHRAEQRHMSLEAAKSLLALCRNCSRASAHFAAELSTRDAVHMIASGEKHFDFEEMTALKDAVSGVPLHQLPDVLVSPAMALAATMRQLRQTVEMAIREHRNMDAGQFRDFFRTLSAMSESLAATTGDIHAEVSRQQELSNAAP